MTEIDFRLKPMVLMLLVETRETPQHFFIFPVSDWLHLPNRRTNDKLFFFFSRIVMAGDYQWANFWRCVSRERKEQLAFTVAFKSVALSGGATGAIGETTYTEFRRE